MALENVANMGIPEQIVYEELIRTVECPTCKGHGRIRRDHPLVIDGATEATTQSTSNTSAIAENSEETKKSTEDEEDDDDGCPVDKSIYDRIRNEMREQGVSQEVFAAVAFSRTQGLLSEILRRSDQGVKENKGTRQNLVVIQEFLAKSESERVRLYKEYKMETRAKRRLRKEYYEESRDPPHRKRTVISAHAKGVMLEYYKKIMDTPDKAGLEVMSNVLNLNQDVIARFFKNERFRRLRLGEVKQTD